jgi:hypothetical protein
MGPGKRVITRTNSGPDDPFTSPVNGKKATNAGIEVHAEWNGTEVGLRDYAE